MLKLTGLSKSFGALKAVDDLSLEIQQGEVFGLLGPNGAGKSTTINMTVGLLAPDAGTVDVAGAGAPTRVEVRAKLGLAPQALALYGDLSADENLRFFAKMQGLSGGRLNERVNWSLDFVELKPRRKDRVSTFSGGMKRRLNMAVALLHDPPFLLFDEPTVGVDPQSRNAIFENILELKRQGRTIVYTTHYMEEAERLCDRIGVIDHGRLLALDTVPKLLSAHGGHDILYADVDGQEQRLETADPFAELSHLREGGKLGKFRVERPNLETVFLNLTGRRLRD